MQHQASPGFAFAGNGPQFGLFGVHAGAQGAQGAWQTGAGGAHAGAQGVLQGVLHGVLQPVLQLVLQLVLHFGAVLHDGAHVLQLEQPAATIGR
jgi:hypothetical protein